MTAQRDHVTQQRDHLTPGSDQVIHRGNNVTHRGDHVDAEDLVGVLVGDDLDHSLGVGDRLGAAVGRQRERARLVVDALQTTNSTNHSRCYSERAHEAQTGLSGASQRKCSRLRGTAD